MYQQVFVIDPDVKRRAAICFLLRSVGPHAEPFESQSEFFSNWPRNGVILTYDANGAIALLMEQLRSRHSWLPVVGYSEAPPPMQVVTAVLDGAVSYVAWPSPRETFLKVVSDCRERSTETIDGAPARRAALASIAALSLREREILAGMSEGLSNREIGKHLHISSRTVELHRANLLNKLGARSSSEAIRIAVEAALSPFGRTDGS